MKTLKTIKTSSNVEFDVIYADGTRERVPEGILFEAKGEKMILHNGTDRPEVLIAVAEAAAEAVGGLDLPDPAKSYIIYNIHKRLFCRKDAAPDMKIK